MVQRGDIENRAVGVAETRRGRAEFADSSVRRARLAAGLTREQLMERSGVSIAMLGLYERVPSQLSQQAALKLSMALSVPTSSLLLGARP